MAEINRELLMTERANLVATRDEAARRAQTADGAIQLIDALLVRLDVKPEPALDLAMFNNPAFALGSEG